MKNFYNNKVNPIVENMNNNYMNTYQYFNNSTENSNNTNNKNESYTELSNKEIQNNSQNNDNSKSNVEQTNNMANLLAGLNNPNLKNLLPLLNGGGNYMDIIKKLSGNMGNFNKNEMIMNLLTNMNKNNTANIQSKNEQDFSYYKSIEDYDILD